MKIRKTLLLLVLAVVFSIVLAACGNSSPSTESSSAAGEEPGTAETNTNGGNILIAYFSHTGNTEEVAGQIADLTGGTLAEIQRAEEYGDLQEEAEAEILEGVHPEITVSVDNVEDYDTIFVGYPIWWGIAAWPVDSFVEANDFTGKTVIPFCTSASSGLGDSGALLAEMAGTGDWQEGMRFRSGADEADVQEWVSGLGL
ncbi:flavodoxin [Claveliimonas bilis]|uniref:flavodoxin n=1 Tax=Claveliimonas bilis TaxID=3028070 RepID=UPI001E51FCDC|nr:flavodoxin [Claveliimonas bilis]BCZ27451.1 flavodoxin [Claveliimonas bilis]